MDKPEKKTKTYGEYFDFDSSLGSQIEAKYDRNDLIDEEHAPILCDYCPGGVRLVPYLTDKLVCPQCMNVYNPTFDTIKHEIREATIEELSDVNAGQMAFIEPDKTSGHPPPTKIRKKLEEQELPEYVQKEIDAIQWRTGYKTVTLDKKLFSTRKDTR